MPFKISLHEKPPTSFKDLLKIQTVDSNHIEPGYTRIALGHPVIPRCRQICIHRGLKVFAVVNSKDPHIDLCRMDPHVGRKAFLFPQTVVNSVVKELHLQNIPLNRKYEAMTGSPAEIRELLLNQFPLIEKDSAGTASAKIRQAWDPKHPERVGNARMPLVDQIQMAVNAYIRHKESNYDTLFKVGNTKGVARAEVRRTCIRKMSEWRQEKLEISVEQFDEIIEFYSDENENENENEGEDEDQDDDDDDDDDDGIGFISPAPLSALPAVSPSGIPILVYGSDGRAFETVCEACSWDPLVQFNPSVQESGELQFPTQRSSYIPPKVYGEDGRILNPVRPQHCESLVCMFRALKI